MYKKRTTYILFKKIHVYIVNCAKMAIVGCANGLIFAWVPRSYWLGLQRVHVAWTGGLEKILNTITGIWQIVASVNGL